MDVALLCHELQISLINIHKNGYTATLSQENPNYSFLLPFAQYNLQCPGYYLPVLQGKWVYPHSNSTCRIWNKIISYSAIRRDPHRGGWVGCGEGVRWHFVGALAKGNVSSSIALAGRGFLPKSCLLIKYSPLCKLTDRDLFAKSQTYFS